MKQSKRTERGIGRPLLGLAAGLVLALIGNNTVNAFETYDAGCNATTGCHGDFRSTTSPKGTVFSGSPANNHNMHRNTMGTECELCHTGPDDVPVFIGSSDGLGAVTGLGCSGCHVGSGLRKHHQAKGVTGCYAGSCHGGTPTSDNPPAENVISPPYYGTAYTLARNPGNTAQVANTNENWSVGDFVGLDNDGNGLADLADYSVGPRERILSVSREGSNVRVTWQSAGGRTNRVRTAGTVTGAYSDLSSAMKISGAGLVTTNYLHVGGAGSTTRFYRTYSP